MEEMPHASFKGKRSIQAGTIGECWLNCIQFIVDHGALHHDEDIALYEVLGLCVEIDKPNPRDPLIDQLGDKDVVARTLAKFSKGVVMPDRPFTYGERIFENRGINQLEWLVERLTAKPETKSATIGLLIPGDRALQPCLVSVDAKIRKNKLELQFFYRSQNVLGRQYANFMALASLQQDIAERCSVVPGGMRGFIASAHIYDFDMDSAKRIASGEKLLIADRYYQEGPKSIRT